MCIGPVKANISLGERLLQAGIISQAALSDAVLAMGDAQFGETRIALTLMELGHVSQEGLYEWSKKEAIDVLRVLLAWQTGDIFFEDGRQAPADRLLIALSCMSLLPQALSLMKTAQSQLEVSQPGVQIQSTTLQQPAHSVMPSASVLMAEPELSTFTPDTPTPESCSMPVSPLSNITMFSSFDEQPVTPLPPPQRLTTPIPPLSVDTSYLRPDTVLVPVDFSSLRGENLQLPLTPERWRLLTRVDGRTTLQQACQELAMPAELLCQVAGELITLGLAQPIRVQQAPVQELSPVSRELILAGLGNGYITPGSAAAAPPPWLAVSPTTDALPYEYRDDLPFETKSQWGNGGNGATFVPGRGWIANSQPLQPMQPSGPLCLNGVYAHAPRGNDR